MEISDLPAEVPTTVGTKEGNGAEKPTDGNMPAYRTGKSAACFWVAAKTGRRPTPLKQKSAFAKAPADKTSDFENSTVRIAKLIAPRGIEPRF